MTLLEELLFVPWIVTRLREIMHDAFRCRYSNMPDVRSAGIIRAMFLI